MTEFRDITPEGNRCGLAQCPSVHISDDEKTLRIAGPMVGIINEHYGEELPIEVQIEISTELMAGYVALCQANAPIPGEASSREGALQTRPSPSSGWQPIESAPKETVVLVFDPNNGVYVDWCDAHWGWDSEPTHWMPLPSPPTPSDTGLKSEQAASDDASPAAIGQPDTTGAPPAPED